MSNTTLNSYQEQAVKTAVYPEFHSVVYPALALPGEVGEVAEKILYEPVVPKDVGKEIGGVLWYCAALARDLDMDLESCGWSSTIEGAQHLMTQVVDNMGVDLSNREKCVLALSCFAGKLANQVKKVLRGDASLEEKKPYIVNDLRAVLLCCIHVANSLDLSLAEIADENIAVLKSRQERGTIKGDGDNR